VGRYARATLQKLIDDGQQDFYKMSAVTFASRRGLPPLQAADLHAYEVYKYFSDQLAGTGRPTRRSFRELLSIPEAGGGGYLFTLDKLQRWFQGIRAHERPIDISVDQLNSKSMVGLTPLRKKE
jgi:hypothetical protein